jgi:hypothetical protein
VTLSRMMLDKGGQSNWAKTLQNFLSLGKIDTSAYFIVLGVHGAEAQAHPARTYRRLANHSAVYALAGTNSL